MIKANTIITIPVGGCTTLMFISFRFKYFIGIRDLQKEEGKDFNKDFSWSRLSLSKSIYRYSDWNVPLNLADLKNLIEHGGLTKEQIEETKEKHKIKNEEKILTINKIDILENENSNLKIEKDDLLNQILELKKELNEYKKGSISLIEAGNLSLVAPEETKKKNLFSIFRK